jgi:hypothetical protein
MLQRKRVAALVLLDEKVRQVKKMGGIVADSHYREGDPAEEVIRLAEELGVGLIITGGRRLAKLKLFWSSSYPIEALPSREVPGPDRARGPSGVAELDRSTLNPVHAVILRLGAFEGPGAARQGAYRRCPLWLRGEHQRRLCDSRRRPPLRQDLTEPVERLVMEEQVSTALCQQGTEAQP